MSDLLAIVQVELMLFAAAGFLLFGIDDLLVDLIWLSRRHLVREQVQLPNAQAFAGGATETCNIAVFVPAWREEAVIGQMLSRCVEAWDGQGYRIFVGCYRNDPATIHAAKAVHDDRISVVLVDRQGPTTKADCLNGIWEALNSYEGETGFHAGAILLHDAEDLVHAGEIDLFAAASCTYDLVQIPVVPELDASSRWIAGHYADEFAESHQKELIVRSVVGASLPSAGTGCSVSRRAMDAMAVAGKGLPFVADSLTEDYELGLRLGMAGYSSRFVRAKDPRTGDLIAVRSCFPAEWDAAVRQKSRWITGIAMAGWDRTGWAGGLAEHWMRWRDRRTVLAAILITTAYVSALLAGAQIIFGMEARQSSILSTLILLNFALLLWRLGIRSVFTSRQYDLWQGLCSIPRIFIANFIAVAAAFRAVFGYVRILRTGTVVWDKTQHIFPGHGDK